jgi:hypothetical protein
MYNVIAKFAMRPTPKAKRGMFKGWTVAELRKEYNKIKAEMEKHTDKVPKALRSKFAQLSFALRAKSGWGKVKAGTLLARLQPLLVTADDIKQSLTVKRLLIKLGFKTHIIEPENNPDFADKDLAELKRTGDFYEIVEGSNKNLAVSVNLRPDGNMFATVGAYQHYVAGEDNWSSMLMQIASDRPIKISDLINIIKQVVPLADKPVELSTKLKEISKTLGWYKFKQVRHQTEASNGIIKIQAASDADAKRVAATILRQLGDNRFIAMTGARNFVRLQAGLQFDLPGRLTKNHANRIAIILTGEDDYTIITYKYRNLELNKLETKTGVQAEQLKNAFVKITGLDTHL